MLCELLSRQGHLKATPLNIKPLEAIKETAPWRRKEATKQDITIEEEEKKEVKPKARPKPKEARTEEEAKQEEPKKREAEEGGDDNKSPNKMVVLTKQIGETRGREKKAGYIKGAMDEIRKKGDHR